GTGVTPKAVLAVVYRGIDPTNPVDVSSTGSARNALTITAPSVTTTGANEQLVMFAGAIGNSKISAWTAPTGMTDRIHASTQAQVSTLIADQSLATAGATGTRTATLANRADLNGIMVAFKLGPVPTYY